jgi:hypothetical protein
MPSRLVTLAIVAFWLGTVVWFFDHDIWPYIRPGTAPPYTIELADEALPGRMVPVGWVCLRNGEKVGTVRTTLRYLEAEDGFELTASSSELVLLRTPVIRVVALDLSDRVQVNRDGELRSLASDVRVSIRVIGQDMSGRVSIGAEVRNDRLERRCRIEVPGLGIYEPALPPVPPTRGTVLNPLHPVPRITGLRPGQHWRQPLVDPRSDILRALTANLPGGDQASALAAPGPQSLVAEVRPEPEVLAWEGGEQPCLVIDYRGDLQGEEFKAHTWVRASDGLVLRQEVEAHGELLVMQRE